MRHAVRPLPAPVRYIGVTKPAIGRTNVADATQRVNHLRRQIWKSEVGTLPRTEGEADEAMTADEAVQESLAQVFAEDPVSAALAKLVRSLTPGDRLPAERDLAAQLNVSRTALRDRLGVLEGLGMLRRRTGSGTYVETLKPDTLALALNLAISSSHLPLSYLESVRIGLERQAAHEAAKRADPVLIAYMRRAIDTMATTDDHSQILAADRTFHQALLRAAGNPALTFFADALADVLAQDLEDRSGRFDAHVSAVSKQVLVDRHLAIHDAVTSGDSALAMQSVDDHFDTLPPAAS
jgi:DNA-binding FadR family transcriptional regulator